MRCTISVLSGNFKTGEFTSQNYEDILQKTHFYPNIQHPQNPLLHNKEQKRQKFLTYKISLGVLGLVGLTYLDTLRETPEKSLETKQTQSEIPQPKRIKSAAEKTAPIITEKHKEQKGLTKE